MKRYRVAVIIILIHALIEVSGFFSMLPIWFMGVAPAEFLPFDIPSVDFVIAGLFWGIFRSIGAVALWHGKMWGFVLSGINCIISLVLMMHLLPFGIMDGILVGTALILMLTQYFGKKKIIE
ncbi:MAG: hypothetical protein FWE28_05735 [Oscillospiraceae bacterium]|nr:hypothetical protein [Oscillospiraceae bacterium]